MLTDGQLVRLPKEAFIELIQTPLLSSVSLEEGRNIAATREAIWLDVRFPEEFEASGLESAVNHPLNTLRMHSGRLDANRTYIVYCDTGTRSAVADARGAFRIDGIAPGKVHVIARAEGFLPGTRRNVEVETGGLKTVELELEKGETLEGRVIYSWKG